MPTPCWRRQKPSDMLTLGEAARAVLLTPDPHDKRRAARCFARAWRQGSSNIAATSRCPTSPLGPPNPNCSHPTGCPSAARVGRSAAGSRCSTRSRISSSSRSISRSTWWAASAANFRANSSMTGSASPPTRRCISRCSTVGSASSAAIMARCRRMPDCGEAAEVTADDALARLAIVPMVLEARGLDVTPATVERFRAVGDEASARILSRISKRRNPACDRRHSLVPAKVRRKGIQCRRNVARLSKIALSGRFEASVQRLGAPRRRFNARILRRYCFVGIGTAHRLPRGMSNHPTPTNTGAKAHFGTLATWQMRGRRFDQHSSGAEVAPSRNNLRGSMFRIGRTGRPRCRNQC